MRRSINAVYKGGHVRPLEPLNLPDGTPVKIVVDEAPEATRQPGQDSLAKIWEIAEDIGPPDLASDLDHYLYGSNEP